jgi:hypothetical protein
MAKSTIILLLAGVTPTPENEPTSPKPSELNSQGPFAISLCYVFTKEEVNHRLGRHGNPVSMYGERAIVRV